MDGRMGWGWSTLWRWTCEWRCWGAVMHSQLVCSLGRLLLQVSISRWPKGISEILLAASWHWVLASRCFRLAVEFEQFVTMVPGPPHHDRRKGGVRQAAEACRSQLGHYAKEIDSWGPHADRERTDGRKKNGKKRGRTRQTGHATNPHAMVQYMHRDECSRRVDIPFQDHRAASLRRIFRCSSVGQLAVPVSLPGTPYAALP
ncbi:hypothetical protein J3F83DRAFT_235187 [Trichoderma novae-zelandiae]